MDVDVTVHAGKKPNDRVSEIQPDSYLTTTSGGDDADDFYHQGSSQKNKK